MMIERLISYKDTNCDFGHLLGSCGGSVMVSDAEAGSYSLVLSVIPLSSKSSLGSTHF